MIDTGGKTERGTALPVALFALVVIGALVAGNFFAGLLEQQAGQNSLFAAQAFEAAEAGLSDLIADADPSGLELLPVGGVPAELGTVVVGERLVVRRQVTRLTATLFLIRATGIRQNADGAALATRSLGLMARVVVEPSATEPALTAARLSPLAERAWVQLY
jgi:hypothetical protein